MGNKPNGTEYKIKTPITVEDEIQILNHTNQTMVTFEFVSSIEHVGSNINTGHYITHYK